MEVGGHREDSYQLVKDLWTDFYKAAQRGTQAHVKGIKILLVFSVIAFLVMSAVLLRFTESSTFCGLCHQMNS